MEKILFIGHVGEVKPRVAVSQVSVAEMEIEIKLLPSFKNEWNVLDIRRLDAEDSSIGNTHQVFRSNGLGVPGWQEPALVGDKTIKIFLVRKNGVGGGDVDTSKTVFNGKDKVWKIVPLRDVVALIGSVHLFDF
jgi:hypothetical protein